MELNGRDAVQICFWQWASKCYTNLTIIYRVCVYDYSILTIFDYNFSVRLPIINVWHFYSLCAALSSIVGAWGMWACWILLSLKLMSIRHLNDIITLKTDTNQRKIYLYSQIAIFKSFVNTYVYKWTDQKRKISQYISLILVT